MENFREKTIVPKESLDPIVQNTANEFQNRTKELISLPEDEMCQYSIVKDRNDYCLYLNRFWLIPASLTKTIKR